MYLSIYCGVCRAQTRDRKQNLIIGFLSNALAIRGTELNLWNYAHFSEKILGHKSIIISKPISSFNTPDVTPETYSFFTERFPVVHFTNSSDVQTIIKQHNIDVLFVAKFGHPEDGLVKFDGCKTIIHAVFDTTRPHGDVFTSISNWLVTFQNMKGKVAVLPNIVWVEDACGDLKEELGIPSDAYVFGCYGGADSYKEEYVRQVVSDCMRDDKFKKYYFIFMHIQEFGPQSDRLIFLPGSTDRKRKRKFIDTCDAMLYGRDNGETFGIACGEFSLCGKPVIAREDVRELAHVELLGNCIIPHRDYESCRKILSDWPMMPCTTKTCRGEGYLQCTPEKVMSTFSDILMALQAV